MKRLWKALRQDLGRKVTALALALLLWGALDNFVVDDKTIPLEVRTVATLADADRERAATPAVYLVVPAELLVQGLSASSVRLKVRGLRDDVEGLNMSAVLIFGQEDLGGDDQATLTRELVREVFRSRGNSPQLTDFDVKPRTLDITLARRATAEITLGPDNVTIEGPLRDGYVFYNSRITVRPNTVRLTGPSALIEPIRNDPALPKLSPVNAKDKSLTVSQMVGLPPELVEQGVTLLTTGGQVEVTVPIVPDDLEVDLLGVPILYRNEDVLATRRKSVLSRPEVIDVKVVGPQSELQALTTDQLRERLWLTYDWRGAPDLLQFTAPVRVAKVDLSRDVKVLDFWSGEEPKIEIELADLAPPANGGSP
jgi:hypothetical protein